MMKNDLISRSALLEDVLVIFDENHNDCHVVFEDDIENAPAVDAVEVVRCKDCKHMNVVGFGYRWCKAWERIQTMGDEGYCNFGERRADNGK